jgi:hypothetical protein
MIYGFGGYGEFTHKEVLLYYSPEDGEWTDILYFGDRPDPLFYGGFHYDDNENLFYFTQYIGFFVYVYQVNPESWEWTLLDKFDLEDKPLALGFSSGLNSFDPNTGLIYLFGSFFYDTQAQVVRKYSISEGLFTKTGLVRFNEDLDRKFWTFVYDLKTQGIHSSDLKEFDAQVFNGNGNDSQNSVLRKNLLLM